jgi:sulfhydrogenase subunit beta (sulfur reductase)
MLSVRWLCQNDLQLLLDLLASEGFRIVGPTLHQQAIVYDEIESIEQLPRGWTDSQSPAIYQIERTPDGPESEKLFHYNLGPHSWKKYLFPPELILPSESSDSAPRQVPEKPIAILGARACELAAIAIQDRVFMNPPFVDSQYALRRKGLFVVAVQCTTAASTCFCPSMNTGPALPDPDPDSTGRRHPFDLSLTELTPSDLSDPEGPAKYPHGFLIQAGSQQGQAILERLPTLEATPEMLQAREQAIDRVTSSIQRSMPTNNLRDSLMARLRHPHWEDVAERCLSCANCTMVCPTCFCSSVDDVHDLVDETILRKRRWDSCFNPDFSHTSGAPVRDSVKSRYRQWLTHKLATWHDQFDTSGCVGCGRCITWCPVGIDLTQEVAKLLES